MAFPLNREYDPAFTDGDFTMQGVSIPESDLRTSSHHQPPLFSYPNSWQEGYASSNDSMRKQQNQVPHNHFSSHSGNFAAHEFDQLHQDFSHGAALTDDQTFNGLNEQEMAAALASFQPCDDCTPATKTAIPHHHHPSGRLAGASAQLDGHFCCSWLVHDQPCFLCFSSAEALDNHIKNDHAGKDGTYRCLWQNCSKHDNSTKTAGPMNFGNKPKLMRHVHSHTGYKPFPCPYPGCDKGFVTKEQLKNHETTHTKSRKYKCDQCGKAFAVKSALTTHITAVHDEKKTHKCDLCGKAFADSSNLSKHKQTHFRDSGVRKPRSKRTASTGTSTRSTPSIPTPTAETATPVVQIPSLHHDFSNPISPGLMAPPAAPPKLTVPSSNLFSPGMPFSYGSMSATSTASSPPPASAFDPDCYCCEQRCPAPECPPSPCPEDDDECDRDGFCDLPTCFGNAVSSSTHTSMPMAYSTAGPYACSGSESLVHPHQMEQLRNFQWEDLMGGESGLQRGMSAFEAEEQFTNMHGS